MLEIKIKPLRSKLAERPGAKRASEGKNSYRKQLIRLKLMHITRCNEIQKLQYAAQSKALKNVSNI